VQEQAERMARGIQLHPKVGPQLRLGQRAPERQGEFHRLLQGGLALLLGVFAVVVRAGRGDAQRA
jgi:hypothetical protein